MRITCLPDQPLAAHLLGMTSDFTVELVSWETHSAQLCDVRYRVFVIEQHVPEEIEVDEYDARVIHAIASDSEGNPIGTGRLSEDGRIGRIAVLREWRGKNVGSEIMQALIERARSERMSSLYLHGQTQSLPFYEKLGFVASGPEFFEAGIPHREMALTL